jgi:hypothetical protein
LRCFDYPYFFLITKTKCMYRFQINNKATIVQMLSSYFFGFKKLGSVYCILLFLLGSTVSFAQIIILPPPSNIKGPSTTTITSNVNPSFTGQSVQLKATVSGNIPNRTPTGTVQFFNSTTNTNLTPGGIPLVNGEAIFITPTITSNTSFTATYSGDNAYLTSTSAIFEQVVSQPPIYIPPVPFYTTTTTLVSSVNPSVAGSQPVTLTATVSSFGGVNVSGIVDFWDNTNNRNLTPGGIAVTNGVATFTTSSLPFGDLNITAIYRGDANGNQPSTSNVLVQRVQLNITGISIGLTTDLSESTSTAAGTSNFGDRVTFIAAVSTGIGAPSGIVSFFDNGVLAGNFPLDGSGRAIFRTNLLTPGNHNITARFYSITSNIVAHTIPRPFASPGEFAGISTPFMSVIHNAGIGRGWAIPSVVYGQPVTLLAHVSGLPANIPTGSVTFISKNKNGLSTLGEVGLDLEGNAFLTVSNLPVGNRSEVDSIIAKYNGSNQYQPNTSKRAILIPKASVGLKLQSSLNPSVTGQQEVALTATVTPAAPSVFGNRPTGTVSFSFNSLIRQVQVNPQTGKAILNTAEFDVGKNLISVEYLGDENYFSSDVMDITQTAERVGSSIFYFLGDAQSTQVNTNFLSPLQFNITELNPKLSGAATVIFTAPSSGASGTFSNGTNTVTVKTTALGSFGVANSGIFRANGIPGTYTVTATIPGFGTATFQMTNTVPPVAVSFGTSVPGLRYTIDGIAFTTNQSFNLAAGSNYTLATTSPQTASNGIPYTFTGWSDGNTSLSRTITIPASPASYMAQFAACEQQWVLNKDGDNYYTGAPVAACQAPEGYVVKGDLLPGDCDDNDATIFPGAQELCDGKDNNCNGQIDEAFCCPVSGIIYVRANATGANNGSSWANAYTRLQDAFETARRCGTTSQIWVARGTYRPAVGINRDSAFVMRNNLAIYGGFAGTETQLSQRNWRLNHTILSGDIGVVGNRSDNSQNVISNDNNGLNATAILDGFIIRDGQYDKSGSTKKGGGGMLNVNSSPWVSNCIFVGNFSSSDGGAVFNQGASATPTFINCVFSGNQAVFGGGIYNAVARTQVINCTFSSNQAAAGGGMFSTGIPFGNPRATVRNSIVWGNTDGILNASYVSQSSYIEVSTSLVQGGYTGTGNLNVNPLFVRQATTGLGQLGDLRLLPCSPAINVGSNAALPAGTTTDLGGLTRTVLTTVDMGAYERQTTGGAIVYLDAGATGNGEGTSWANAHTTLEAALNDLNLCNNGNPPSLHIATGTYLAPIEVPFIINKLGARVWGGYPRGGGTRNPAANPVIFKGNVEVLKSATIDGVRVQQ